MSRSYKKAIWKEKSFGNKLYNRITKRSVNNSIKNSLLLNDLNEFEVIDKKNIVDDWTRCDYIVDYEYNTDSWGIGGRYKNNNEAIEYKNKLRRK